MGLLLLYVALALVFSFLCSILEAVLLSITPSHLALMEQQQHPVAGATRALKDDVERPLSAILSLNTVAHTVGAAGAGAQAAYVFGDAAVGIFSAVLTLAILIFTEIIPKTLGARYWKTLTPFAVPALRWLMVAMAPLVWLSRGITHLITRNDEPEVSVSRAEFSALADIGTEEGVFEEDESRILKSLFAFRLLRARDVMTPRTVVFMLHQDTLVSDVLGAHPHLRFSRIPIFAQNRDDMAGYVLKDDLLLRAARGETDVPLLALKRDFLVVPEGLPLPQLFERLLDRGEHIALVVDEYGGVAGIVTMEDVVETLLGLEIVDEADADRDMQVLARERWRQRARALGLLDSDAEEAVDEVIVRSHLTGGTIPPSGDG